MSILPFSSMVHENETLEKMQYVYDNYNIKTDREEVKKNVKKRI